MPSVFRKRTARELTETEAAYLAGIIDGEGHIGIHKRKDRGDERLYVSVINTDKPLMKWLSEICGTISHRGRKGSLGKRPCYTWNVYPVADAIAILHAISPYVKVKKEIVLKAISWCEARLSGDKSHLTSG